jgi:hypothetical protein
MALVVLLSGGLFLSLWKKLEQKRFSSDVARLATRIEMVQKLAINTETDWKGTLAWDKKEDRWVFTATCLDSDVRHVPALLLAPLTLRVNGREVSEVAVDFFSSGEIRPVVPLRLQRGDSTKTLTLSHRMEGDGKREKGPDRP